MALPFFVPENGTDSEIRGQMKVGENPWTALGTALDGILEPRGPESCGLWVSKAMIRHFFFSSHFEHYRSVVGHLKIS